MRRSSSTPGTDTTIPCAYQIEPMTALVWVQPDKTEVWTSTQNPFGVQDAMAQTLNLPPEQVIVYPLMSGGAFGRKR